MDFTGIQSLLSPDQWGQFESAIRSVTDTFNRLEVHYFLAKPNPDRWGEDQDDQAGGYDEYTLAALGTYGVTQGDQANETAAGTIANGGLSLAFNLEYLREQGLINDDDTVKFNAATDYFVANRVRYKVDAVAYDGQLQGKYALVVVNGRPDNYGPAPAA
jgi:hypothetical protein